MFNVDNHFRYHHIAYGEWKGSFSRESITLLSVDDARGGFHARTVQRRSRGTERRIVELNTEICRRSTGRMEDFCDNGIMLEFARDNVVQLIVKRRPGHAIRTHTEGNECINSTGWLCVCVYTCYPNS